jgi:glyoxylase-like metal-dependent hydrolase (beta-lactamase superfamily II)
MTSSGEEDIMPMNQVGRVSVVSTGTVEIRPQHVESDGSPLMWWLFTSRKWTEPLPINVYVIEHSKGLVLFDTGQDRASVTDPEYFPRGFAGLLYRRLARFAIGESETLTRRLAGLGHDIADVHSAVISHLHQDHIGALPELGHANLVISEAEWRTLDQPRAELNGVMRQHIDLPGLNWHRIEPEPTTDPALAPFTAAHDLFGDGSLVLLPTPGHTAGSLSLLVRRSGRAPLRMVGDITYDVHRMEHLEVPGVGDRDELRETTRKVLALRAVYPDLVVLPAHDPGAADRLAAVEQADPARAR